TGTRGRNGRQAGRVSSRPTTPLQAAALPLRELGCFARLVQAGLLALDLAGVAGEEALALERDAEVGVDLDEGAGDAVADRAGVARGAAAVPPDAQVVGARELGGLERRQDHLPMGEPREVRGELLAVDPRLPGPRTEDHPGDGGLPLPGAEVLGRSRHQKG